MLPANQTLPDLIVCKVCQSALAAVENYCPGCGYNFKPQRITTKLLLSQVYKAFDLDFGILYTLHALFYQPGETLRSYLAGERKRITNPFRFYLLALVLQGFLLELNHAQINVNPAETSFFGQLILYIQRYPSLVLAPYLFMSSLILSSFASHHKFNTAETFVFHVFTLSEAYFLYSTIEITCSLIRLIPGFGAFIPSLFSTFFIFFPAIYYGYSVWAFVSFYRDRSFYAVFSFTFVLLLGFLVYLCVLGVLAALASFAVIIIEGRFFNY
jgi:Protein of unknown function (DUF3667)